MALAALIVSVIAVILSCAATWYTRRAAMAAERLTVTIRDDHPWRGQGTPLAGGPTPEQVAAQIWGPLRFIPGTGPGADPVRGVPGADATGRTTPTAGMPVGEELPFFLEPTTPSVLGTPDHSGLATGARHGAAADVRVPPRRDGTLDRDSRDRYPGR